MLLAPRLQRPQPENDEPDCSDAREVRDKPHNGQPRADAVLAARDGAPLDAAHPERQDADLKQVGHERHKCAERVNHREHADESEHDGQLHVVVCIARVCRPVRLGLDIGVGRLCAGLARIGLRLLVRAVLGPSSHRDLHEDVGDHRNDVHDDEHRQILLQLVHTLGSFATLDELAHEGEVEEGVVVHDALDQEGLRDDAVFQLQVRAPILILGHPGGEHGPREVDDLDVGTYGEEPGLRGELVRHPDAEEHPRMAVRVLQGELPEVCYPPRGPDRLRDEDHHEEHVKRSDGVLPEAPPQFRTEGRAHHGLVRPTSHAPLDVLAGDRLVVGGSRRRHPSNHHDAEHIGQDILLVLCEGDDLRQCGDHAQDRREQERPCLVAEPIEEEGDLLAEIIPHHVAVLRPWPLDDIPAL
mmetsp:Transcript_105933/g.304588  ORF Transcript_105933/g.304588 Transcript_105933/m.304588 type:complete len:413 (+) Transcript_105933:359-1597(+)